MNGALRVALVARETLAEAEDFARAQGLNPVCFVAAPQSQGFTVQPFFGRVRGVKDRAEGHFGAPAGARSSILKFGILQTFPGQNSRRRHRENNPQRQPPNRPRRRMQPPPVTAARQQARRNAADAKLLAQNHKVTVAQATSPTRARSWDDTPDGRLRPTQQSGAKQV